jgi:uncharacterized protein YjbI with pentapeptide repeats
VTIQAPVSLHLLVHHLEKLFLPRGDLKPLSFFDPGLLSLPEKVSWVNPKLPLSFQDQSLRFTIVLANDLKEAGIPLNFTGSNLQRSTFIGDFKRAVFNLTLLKGADFSLANLEGSSFKSYSTASFNTFKDVIWPQDSNLSHINFENCVFEEQHFKSFDFSRSNFSSGAVNYVTVADSQLNSSTFRKSYFLSSQFVRSEMRNVNFFSANIISSEFIDVDFRNSDFKSTHINNCRFENCDFRGTNIREADFLSVKFINCQFDEGISPGDLAEKSKNMEVKDYNPAEEKSKQKGALSQQERYCLKLSESNVLTDSNLQVLTALQTLSTHADEFVFSIYQPAPFTSRIAYPHSHIYALTHDKESGDFILTLNDLQLNLDGNNYEFKLTISKDGTTHFNRNLYSVRLEPQVVPGLTSAEEMLIDFAEEFSNLMLSTDDHRHKHTVRITTVTDADKAITNTIRPSDEKSKDTLPDYFFDVLRSIYDVQ